MKLRENWFHVPSLWISEGMFVKRSHLFPKMIINEANVYVTDSFYRINMKEGYKIGDLVFSFYNTLTFILAELEGRYYGGGVLELTPNEFKHLGVPYFNDISPFHIAHLENLISEKSDINTILNYTDNFLLKNALNLNTSDILFLRKIYKKLVNRRLKRPLDYLFTHESKLELSHI